MKNLDFSRCVTNFHFRLVLWTFSLNTSSLPSLWSFSSVCTPRPLLSLLWWVNWNVKLSHMSSPVTALTWVSLRKFFGGNKIKSLKIFLYLDNYEQKGVKVEAFWQTFSKILLKSYNQKLRPTRKDPSILLRSYGFTIKRPGLLWKNMIKSILLSLLLSLLFQVPSSKLTLGPRHHPCLILTIK